MSKRHVFVFGSNLAGRHGKGAALFAARHKGAVRGQGVGPQGDSYAIPTKDFGLRTLPLERVAYYVRQFLGYARSNPGIIFDVTRIGCGHAGYRDEQVAPLFRNAPSNCRLPVEWKPLLSDPLDEAFGGPQFTVKRPRRERNANSGV